jgi:hypothetical protein
MQTAQAAWLRQNHPELAGRWVEPGKGSQMFRASPVSASEESPNPRTVKLPRKSGQPRDFSMLVPGPVARHTPAAASEQEAMREGGVEAHLGSRGGLMDLKDGTSGFALRDSKLAGRKRV